MKKMMMMAMCLMAMVACATNTVASVLEAKTIKVKATAKATAKAKKEAVAKAKSAEQVVSFLREQDKDNVLSPHNLRYGVLTDAEPFGKAEGNWLGYASYEKKVAAEAKEQMVKAVYNIVNNNEKATILYRRISGMQKLGWIDPIK